MDKSPPKPHDRPLVKSRTSMEKRPPMDAAETTASVDAWHTILAREVPHRTARGPSPPTRSILSADLLPNMGASPLSMGASPLSPPLPNLAGAPRRRGRR
eukprot:2329790-Prymnesium_polylepis.1